MNMSKNNVENKNCLTLQEAVSRFYVLKASDVLQMEGFQRQQDINTEWMNPDDCNLLIFISHRWETLRHPDPNGKQLAGIQLLIRLICNLCEAFLAEDNHERLRLVPSLRQYGMVQATVILSKLLSSNSFPSIKKEQVFQVLPERIGIWYDFSCMPQSPRSQNQEKDFNNILRSLPDLLRSDEISFIALREAEDDYESRGWCFAEARLASEKTTSIPLVLRLDLLDTILEYWIPETERNLANNQSAVNFEISLATWENSSLDNVNLIKCWHNIVLLCSLRDTSLMLKKDTLTLGLSKSDNPGLIWIGLLLAELINRKEQVFNFTDVILSLFQRKGLHCSEDNDLVYVGLLALYSSCAPESPIREFLQDCLKRYLNQEKLLMRVTISKKPFVLDDKNSQNIGFENLMWKFIE